MPSPKSHAKLYGGTPPPAVAVNVTEFPGEGLVGEYVKLADSGWSWGGGLEESFQPVSAWSSQWPGRSLESQKTNP